MRIYEQIAKFLKKFFLIDDSPHKIAGGAALGIFLGIIPGEGVISTLVLASVFRLNRLAATAGVLASNMWMTLVVLPPAAYIGATLFQTDYQLLIANFRSTYNLGLKYFLSKVIFLELVLPLIFGFLVVAGVIALAFYFFLYFLLKYQKIRFK